MRLFIGIGLPHTAGERLANAAHGLLPATANEGARIHWTRPGNLHVTLSFMGEVEPALLKEIEQKLAALRADRLSLELGGISILANAGILLAKLKPSAGLFTFAEQVFLAMEGCGIPREQRPYMPHVTLARIKDQTREQTREQTKDQTRGRRTRGKVRARIRLEPAAGDDPAFWQTFEATEFRLYQSFTLPGGSEYRVLRSFPLE